MAKKADRADPEQTSFFIDLDETKTPPPPGRIKSSEPKKLKPREIHRLMAQKDLLIEIAYLMGEEKSLPAYIKLLEAGRFGDLRSQSVQSKLISARRDLRNIQMFAKSLLLSSSCYLCQHSQTCSERYNYKRREETTNALLKLINPLYDEKDDEGISQKYLDAWRREQKKDIVQLLCRKCREIAEEIQADMQAKSEKEEEAKKAKGRGQK